MELIDAKYKIRCELGACRNVASTSIKLSRVGIRSQIHICDECMKTLYTLIGERTVPKSMETLKKKNNTTLRDKSIYAETMQESVRENTEEDIQRMKKHEKRKK